MLPEKLVFEPLEDLKEPGQGDLTEHRIQDTTRNRAVKSSEDSSNSVLLKEKASGRSE